MSYQPPAPYPPSGPPPGGYPQPANIGEQPPAPNPDLGYQQAAAPQGAYPQTPHQPSPYAQGQFDPVADAQANKVQAVLAYLGLLVLIPIFAAKDSRFARYHANQGLVLMLAGIAYGILWGVIAGVVGALAFGSIASGSGAGLALGGIVTTVFGLVFLVFPVLAIIGIVHAVQGEAKPLPVIGRFTILK
ncbi:MAG: hypothetical protein LBO20_02740 [Bifidobacteriaceae bacterium]|jgi:uncharacterized membrane protein|nr:hypothetical protein [Bifidobacteriaceae bacterium]